MQNSLKSLATIFLALHLLTSMAHAQKPTLPAFEKIFKTDVHLYTLAERGYPAFKFATDEDMATFKKKLTLALGEKWTEIPAPETLRAEALPPGTSDPFSEENKRKRPKNLGIAWYSSGKKGQWRVQLVLTEQAVKGKKYTADITMFKIEPKKKK